MYAICYAYSCTDAMFRKIYRSMEADMLSLPYRTYGVDVIVEIGYLRHEEMRSMEEILAGLRSLGIRMNIPECYDLSHVFEELIAIRPVEFDPDWYDTVMGMAALFLQSMAFSLKGERAPCTHCRMHSSPMCCMRAT